MYSTNISCIRGLAEMQQLDNQCYVTAGAVHDFVWMKYEASADLEDINNIITVLCID